MSNQSAQRVEAELDLSDVDHRVGKLVGGGQLWEPCTSMDIRRWVMGMDYPNPIHWDEELARKSKFGGIIAPQTMAAAMDYGHGSQPACVGRIPGSHLLFGGEEWWYYGYRIKPGDKLFQERRFHDYKVTETKFAGPTMFARGDTIHRNQHGSLVAKARQTVIRYLVAEAKKRKMFEKNNQTKIPVWTEEALQKVEKVRQDWIISNRLGVSPHFDEIDIGDRLPRRVLGPHTVASFSTEYRAFMWNAWGAYHFVGVPGVKDPWINQDPGWVEGFGYDEEGAKIDPRKRDGLYLGPSRGHVDSEKGARIGVPRGYGYGATMAAWTTDYVAYWAGHDGMVRHSKMQFRTPAFEGDVTYLDGEITERQAESTWGAPLVTVNVRMTNQDGAVLAEGPVEVEVPL
jgi:acyl dehydratase